MKRCGIKCPFCGNKFLPPTGFFDILLSLDDDVRCLHCRMKVRQR